MKNITTCWIIALLIFLCIPSISAKIISPALVPDNQYFIETFEDYAGNIEPIADFETNESWTNGERISSCKTGSSCLRLTSENSSLNYSSLSLDTKLKDFEHIGFWLYISDASFAEFINISFETALDNYTIQKEESGLLNGWNYIIEDNPLYEVDSNVTAIGISIKSKENSSMQAVFDNMMVFKDDQTNGTWTKREGIWNILYVNETDNIGLVYAQQDTTKSGHSTNEYHSIFRKVSQPNSFTLTARAKSYTTFRINFKSDSSLGAPLIKLFSNELKLYGKNGYVSNDITHGLNISAWNYYKIVSDKETIKFYTSSDENFKQQLSESSPNLESSGNDIGFSVYYNNMAYFDDILVQNHFKNATSTDSSQGIAYSSNNLTATYLYNGNSQDFKNETIEFYKNNNLTYTIFNEDYYSKNKSIPYSYLLLDDKWYAKITVCDIFGCLSALTQNVTIVNSPPYLLSGPSIDDRLHIGETVKCVSNPLDFDNDTITSSWRWYNNSGIIEDEESSELNLTLDNARKGGDITCSQKVCDDFSCSEWYNSSTVKIENYIPKINLVEILPEISYQEDAFISVDVEDYDNETLDARLTLIDSNGAMIFNNTKMNLFSSIESSNTTWHSQNFTLGKIGIWNFKISIEDNEKKKTKEGYFIVPNKNYPPEIIFAALAKNKKFIENISSDIKILDIVNKDIKSLEIGYSTTAIRHYNTEKGECIEEEVNVSSTKLSSILTKNDQSWEGVDENWNILFWYNADNSSLLEKVGFYFGESVGGSEQKRKNCEWKNLSNGWNLLTKQISNCTPSEEYSINWSDIKEIRMHSYSKYNNISYNNTWGAFKLISPNIAPYLLINENAQIAPEDNLSLVYLYSDRNNDKLKNLTIKWYKNEIIQEELTQISLFNNSSLEINNLLSSDYLSFGDEWHAELTICDDRGGCSTASTLKVNVISAEKLKFSEQFSSRITGFAISALENFSGKKSIFLLPLILMALFILEFIVNEMRIRNIKRNSKIIRIGKEAIRIK